MGIATFKDVCLQSRRRAIRACSREHRLLVALPKLMMATASRDAGSRAWLACRRHCRTNSEAWACIWYESRLVMDRRKRQCTSAKPSCSIRTLACAEYHVKLHAPRDL